IPPEPLFLGNNETGRHGGTEPRGRSLFCARSETTPQRGPNPSLLSSQLPLPRCLRASQLHFSGHTTDEPGEARTGRFSPNFPRGLLRRCNESSRTVAALYATRC